MSLIISVRFAPYAATGLDSVRNGISAASIDRCWLESFGSCAFATREATVQVGKHDTADVGSVMLDFPHGQWWYADLLIPDEHVAVVRPYLFRGSPVSLGGQVIEEEKEDLVGTRWIHRAKLHHPDRWARVDPDLCRRKGNGLLRAEDA